MLSRTESAEYDVEHQTLRIGQLAGLASVGVETLRFYEREGLLERPYQHPSGYRAYPMAAVARVQTIKRAQALGFRLAEIRELLKGSRSGHVSEHATRKLREVDARIAELLVARRELVRLAEYRCDQLVGCSCGQGDCPLRPVPTANNSAELHAVSLAGASSPKKRNVVAGGLAAAACAICCAPVAASLLAALGLPALGVGEGAEFGIGAAAVVATGAGLVHLQRRRTGHKAMVGK